MKPFYKDNHNTIYCLDFRKNDLPDESVQCVVTSPPYWGLRKYSGEQELIWGGDKNCEHQWDIQKISLLHENRNFQTGTQKEVLASGSPLRHTHKTSELRAGFCSLCDAWRGAYGLEPQPEMYVEHTLLILREIRRVLRKDGVVFWDIGDTYFSNPSNQQGRGQRGSDAGVRAAYENLGRIKRQGNLKPKDLCLIPFRVAIAAQEDGWWIRSVIIWSKPNPMPESVTDRPTESHEYILMLTKSARYYWDHQAIRETSTEKPSGNISRKENIQPRESHFATSIPYQPNGAGRNIRTVWGFPTKPGPGKEIRNFAVFPEKLPEICIKAATPEVGCCSKCGAPWERILDKKPSDFNIRVRDAKAGRATPEEGYKATQEEIDNYPGNHPDPGYRQTTGWRPTCKCKGDIGGEVDKVPSIVLDPLAGAGTTLWVAKKLNRRAVGYEISEEYCQLAVDRCRQQVLL